jgi:hypothetical protein
MRIRILAALMNVRAAWKASHRLPMLDQSDGSASTVHRPTFFYRAPSPSLDRD